MAVQNVSQSAANAGKGSLAYELARRSNQRSSGVLRSPGLRVKGGSASAIVQNENVFEAIVADVLVRKAQSDMPALVGTVVTTAFGLWVFTMDAAGTTAVTALASGATIGAIQVPSIATDVVLLGGLLVNPTGTGSFVGGTTVLDDVTVVPNAVFYQGVDLGALVDRISFRETGVPA